MFFVAGNACDGLEDLEIHWDVFDGILGNGICIGMYDSKYGTMTINALQRPIYGRYDGIWMDLGYVYTYMPTRWLWSILEQERIGKME